MNSIAITLTTECSFYKTISLCWLHRITKAFKGSTCTNLSRDGRNCIQNRKQWNNDRFMY